MSIAKAFGALLDKHTGNSAPKEVVAYRNSVCLSCPQRRAPKSLLEKTMVKAEGIPKEPVLGDVCNICSCSLGLLNTATEQRLPDDNEVEMSKRPTQCWLHTART